MKKDRKAEVLSPLTPGQIQLIKLLADICVDQWLAEQAALPTNAQKPEQEPAAGIPKKSE